MYVLPGPDQLHATCGQAQQSGHLPRVRDAGAAGDFQAAETGDCAGQECRGDPSGSGDVAVKSQWIEIPNSPLVMRYEGPKWVSKTICRIHAPDGTVIDPLPWLWRRTMILLMKLTGARWVFADTDHRPE